MINVLPCYKSHYSCGKSVLTLDKPSGNIEKYPISIFDLIIHSKLDFLCLVEDSMTGFLEASKNCQDNKLKLIYGLRLRITSDIANQDEASMNKRAKYVIFAKNINGYKALIKIWSLAAKSGFYYTPCIDFKHLKSLWNDDLMLVSPFYDSFIHLNTFEGHFHVPEFDFTKPKFFVESNGIPFDPFLKKKVIEYATKNNFDVINAQTIYYRARTDFLSYLTFRCISERTTIEKPEFNHMCSNEFSFEKWLNLINK